MYHPILKRQLRKLGLHLETPPDALKWGRFLERVNGSYSSADMDRYTLERSLSLSSEEMRQLTQQLQEALEQLRKLSMTDELTGLRNRRFLNATIHEEIAQVIRNYRNLRMGGRDNVLSNIDLAFLMVDIDHFKDVNDTHGHAAGDQVLVQVCQLLSAACRETDTVIRWGGEEFLILARSLNRPDLGTLCERIRLKVGTHPFQIGPGTTLRVTCSVGGAVFPFLDRYPKTPAWERIAELADACLYAAKHSGRDTWVWLASTPLASPEDFLAALVIPTAIQEGKLEAHSSLPEGTPIQWSELG